MLNRHMFTLGLLLINSLATTYCLAQPRLSKDAVFTVPEWSGKTYEKIIQKVNQIPNVRVTGYCDQLQTFAVSYDENTYSEQSLASKVEQTLPAYRPVLRTGTSTRLLMSNCSLGYTRLPDIRPTEEIPSSTERLAAPTALPSTHPWFELAPYLSLEGIPTENQFSSRELFLTALNEFAKAHLAEIQRAKQAYSQNISTSRHGRQATSLPTDHPWYVLKEHLLIEGIPLKEQFRTEQEFWQALDRFADEHKDAIQQAKQAYETSQQNR
ncbi:MAG: hypothetical protein NZ108_02410 [Bacteroidia bacterium]|nr:hypothetical protein [Bacteroidia bacterium]